MVFHLCHAVSKFFCPLYREQVTSNLSLSEEAVDAPVVDLLGLLAIEDWGLRLQMLLLHLLQQELLREQAGSLHCLLECSELPQHLLPRLIDARETLHSKILGYLGQPTESTGCGVSVAQLLHVQYEFLEWDDIVSIM